MTGYIPDQGDVHFLDLMTSVNHTLHLHSNDVTAGLSEAQIAALTVSFFLEATFPGYAAAGLTGGSWTVVAGNPGSATFAEQTFTRSTTGAAENVWGFYVTRDSDGQLAFFEALAAPIVVATGAQEVRITPRLNFHDNGAELMPVASIIEWPTATAPTGWLLCDGQAVSRSAFALLFAEIGVTYGIGDGSTTFNLPDLRGRFPLGKASAGTGSTLAGTGGALDHVHDHDGANALAQIEILVADGDLYQRAVSGSSYTNTRKTQAGPYAADGSSSSQGAGLAGDTQGSNPPYLVLNYVIRAT